MCKTYSMSVESYYQLSNGCSGFILSWWTGPATNSNSWEFPVTACWQKCHFELSFPNLDSCRMYTPILIQLSVNSLKSSLIESSNTLTTVNPVGELNYLYDVDLHNTPSAFFRDLSTKNPTHIILVEEHKKHSALIFFKQQPQIAGDMDQLESESDFIAQYV